MDKLPEQIYRFLLKSSNNLQYEISYRELAYLYVEDLRAIYDAVNALVQSGRVECNAVSNLGDGDYMVRFEIK